MRRKESGTHRFSSRWNVWAFIALVFLSSSIINLLPFSQRSSAVTSVPTKINFQGRLTDSAGNVKPDGVYNMKFRLFTVSSAGSSVWNEDRLVSATNGVTVTNGLFSTRLGDVTAIPASLFASGSLYLEVELPTPATATTSGTPTWTEGPMSTRSLLSTSAYAFNSETLDGLDSAAFGQLSANNTFTGTNLFKPGSNSATGFQVQNAGTVPMFTVDAIADRVVIGNTTADAVGVVLALDIKNTAGDPTGIDGAMYYNSNAGKFRCYQASAWTDCVGAGGSSTLQDVYNNDTAGTPSDIVTTSAAKTVLVKAGSTFDAASLFTVQDAAGNELLQVDSANDRVYIGDSTADATGVVLALDMKNTAGDPSSSVDGAMYYNSDSKNFRCRHNSLWQDCDFSSLRAEWVMQEDFANASLTSLSIGSQGWLLASIGTGGTLTRVNSGADASDQGRWGVIQLNSPATALTGVHLRMDNSSIAGVPSNLVTEFDFAPVNAAAAAGLQQTIRIGLLDSVGTAAAADGLYFMYNTTTAAGNWQRCTQVTCVDTGVARTTTANAYQRFRIQTNSAGTSVEFFINEVSVGVVTTNLPGSFASYGPTVNADTVDATIRQWKIDYFQMKRNLTTLR